MADYVINSLATSATCAALSKDSGIDHLIYKLNKSPAPFSKQNYNIQFPSNSQFNQKIRLKLHRIGIICGMQMIVRVDLKESSGESMSTFRGGWLNFFKRITITDGKHVIQTITPEWYNYWMSTLTYKKQMAIMAGIKYTGIQSDHLMIDGTIPGANEIGDITDSLSAKATCYMVLPFPSFIGSSQRWVDASFLSQLYVEIDVNPLSSFINACSSSTIDYSSSSLQVSYVNLPEELYQQYQKSNYSLNGKNLNWVLSEIWEEQSVASASLDGNVAGSTKEVVTVDLNCNRLVKRIYVRVSGASISNGIGGIEIFGNIRLFMNGAKWGEWRANSLQLQRVMNGGKSDAGPLIIKMNKNYSEETYDYLQYIENSHNTFDRDECSENLFYIIDLTVPKFSDILENPAFEGGVSLSSVSQPYLEVDVHAASDTAQVYTVHCYCETYNILNVNQFSGEITQSEGK